VRGEYQNNYVRGVCSYPPKTDIIQYGNSFSSDSTFVLTSAHSIEITCPEDFTVYFSNTPDFTPDPSDENVVGYYTAQKHGDNYDRQISCKELSFGQSEHDYLYMRFVSNKASTLTPSLWNVSSCLANTILIQSGDKIPINSSSEKLVYRMNYEDWAGYSFTTSWDVNATFSAYISHTCGFVTTDPAILKTIVLNRRRPSLEITADVVDSWATGLSGEGYLYLRLVSSELGDVTFTSAKPSEIN
jgi:hypothetical protein